MIDLHTHILPGMDDGAGDCETALQMLQTEAEQDVSTVALTPHFYRTREHAEDFLRRRKAAAENLTAAAAVQNLPELILGAEVAWAPGMTEWPELEELCYAGTRVLLVELPFTPWNDELFRQLYALEGRRGIMPMIAHVERYFGLQDKKLLRQLLEMEFPLQVSAESLLHLATRRQALRLLQQSDCVLISDCHDPVDRSPNLASAMAVVERKLGPQAAAGLMVAAEEILAD